MTAALRITSVVPQRQAFALPLSLNPLHGAFCEPLACCLHGIDIAGIKTGASVLVLGGGVIGLLVVQLARLARRGPGRPSRPARPRAARSP